MMPNESAFGWVERSPYGTCVCRIDWRWLATRNLRIISLNRLANHGRPTPKCLGPVALLPIFWVLRAQL